MASKNLDSFIKSLEALECEHSSKANAGNPDRTFYPPMALRGLFQQINLVSILAEVSSLQKHQLDLFALLIRSNAMKILAILCLVENGKYAYMIEEFLCRRIHDSKLPINEHDIDFISRSLSKGTQRQILAMQWKFLPVEFRKADINQRVAEIAILPFQEDAIIGEGAFGTVYKIRIHPECHNFSEVAEENIFARKELRVSRDHDSEEAILAEREILELLRELRHPNIIELLASYQSEDTHNFIFPYAPTDLKTFLKRQIHMSSDDMYIALHGLASAIAHIHNFSLTKGTDGLHLVGYHHDLHPGNILVIGSRFVVSDFGLSRFKSLSMTSKDIARGGVDEYKSPEARSEEDLRNELIGRASDVWSFGCILAEIATIIEEFLLEDFRAVRREEWHAAKDPFGKFIDSAFHLHGKVRVGVLTWLTQLEDRSRPPKDPETPSMVCLIREILQPNWRVRMKIGTLVERLAIIAFNSKVAAVEDVFRSNFHIRDHPLEAFIWLEGKRFEAAAQMYREMIRESHDSFQRRAENALRAISNVQERLREAQHNRDVIPTTPLDAFDSEYVQNFYQSLDGFVELLPKYLRDRLNFIFVQEVVSIEDVNILRAIKRASVPDRYSHVGSRAAMKLVACSISDAMGEGRRMELVDEGVIDVDPKNMQANHSQDLIQEKINELRSTGTYSRGDDIRRVLIEWRKYDVRLTAVPAEEQLDRLNQMARFFNADRTPRDENFPKLVLSCLCFFHQSKLNRFGFVYGLREDCSPTLDEFPNHYSLYEYIRDTSADKPSHPGPYTPRPALGQRFALARDLATTLNALHEVGWLHKNVSSHSILMFCRNKREASRHLSSAVLAGFVYSRFAESKHSGDSPRGFINPYVHPKYQEAKAEVEETTPVFRRVHEYYSLGVVLLEMGLWVTAFALYQRFLKLQPALPSARESERMCKEAFGEMLVQDFVPMLGERVGELYMEAVRFCLSADALVKSIADDYDTRKLCGALFKENVVDRLSKCVA